MMVPLFRRWGKPFIDTMKSLSSGARTMGSGDNAGRAGPQPGAFILEDKNPRRGMGPRSVNPITNFTFSESEERIYQQEQDAAASAPSHAGGRVKTVSGDNTSNDRPIKPGIEIKKQVEFTVESRKKQDVGSEETYIEGNGMPNLYVSGGGRNRVFSGVAFP